MTSSKRYLNLVNWTSRPIKYTREFENFWYWLTSQLKLPLDDNRFSSEHRWLPALDRTWANMKNLINGKFVKEWWQNLISARMTSHDWLFFLKIQDFHLWECLHPWWVDWRMPDKPRATDHGWLREPGWQTSHSVLNSVNKMEDSKWEL